MSIFEFIQTVANHTIVVFVSILTTFGIGTTLEYNNPLYVDKNPVQEIGMTVISDKEEQTLTREKDNIEETVITEEKPVKNMPPEPKNNEVEGVEILAETPVEVPIEIPEDDQNPPLTFSQINTETKEAIVNILCSQNVAGAVTPITGSGVIIDPRGIVITNAHVAQFFLLEDYPIKNSLECILRTGSPARNMYTAELLYISPEWVQLHAQDIKNSEAKGTGEHDYAFLRITGRTDPNAKLPITFPFIPFDINAQNIKTDDTVLAAAYPAGFLGSISIQRNFYSVTSIATVGERFTFLEKTIDLFSIGGTVVSQGGSSGGAVVSDKNKLIGVIVTSTKADTTAERNLRAITVGYINRSLIENTGTTIEGLLFGDIELKAKLFNFNITPSLTALFFEYLVK